MTVSFDATQTLALAIAVLFVGSFVIRRVGFLRLHRYNCGKRNQPRKQQRFPMREHSCFDHGGTSRAVKWCSQ